MEISNPNPTDWTKVFTWDSILDKAASGAAGAIASAILKEILGPSAWEKQVTSDLSLIIHKLDEILQAVEALRKYIPVALENQWRNETIGKLDQAVLSVCEIVSGIRSEGYVSDSSQNYLNSATTHLRDMLGEIVGYRDFASGRPLGMPLYAACAAGVVQLVVAQRVLGLPSSTTSSTIDNFVVSFESWISEVDRQAVEWDAAVKQIAAYFESMPHSAAIAWADPGGSPNLDYSPDPPVGMVIGYLFGGFNADWTYSIGMKEYPAWSAAMNEDDSTFPQLRIYGVPRPHLRPETTQEWDPLELGRAFGEARFKATVLADLIAKRHNALLCLDSRQGLEAVSRSMRKAIDIFKSLRPAT